MRMRFLIANQNKTFLFSQHIYPFKAERLCKFQVCFYKDFTAVFNTWSKTIYKQLKVEMLINIQNR